MQQILLREKSIYWLMKAKNTFNWILFHQITHIFFHWHSFLYTRKNLGKKEKHKTLLIRGWKRFWFCSIALHFLGITTQHFGIVTPLIWLPKILKVMQNTSTLRKGEMMLHWKNMKISTTVKWRVEKRKVLFYFKEMHC